MDTQNSSQTEEFYTSLLTQALNHLDQLKEPIMVCGPIFSAGNYERNIGRIEQVQQKLRNEGLDIFDQIPYLDSNLTGAPLEPDKKFEIFYKGLISSGKISKCVFLDNWESSNGARQEMVLCQTFGIPVEILDSPPTHI